MRTTKFQNLRQVEKYFNYLLDKHWLIDNQIVNLKESGYFFQWDNAKRRFGQCNYSRKRITISKNIAQENLSTKNALKTVFLHEIAHAINRILYDDTGHSNRWKRICLTIGGDGEAYYSADNVKQPLSKYTLVCPNCGYTIKKYKKPKVLRSCGRCSNSFDKNKIFKIITNY